VTPQPISRALTQDLTLQVLDAWGRSIDLPATFGYDAADPWAVWITFHGAAGRTTEPISWAVGRNLLLQGLTDPAGEGDVRLFPSVDENGRAAVVMELCSPDGRLVTQMCTSELYRFLSRTLAVVPLGTERVDLDLLVESLTGQSEPQ
jgi:Streptomyces sporulation and cell division protein, SsgA